MSLWAGGCVVKKPVWWRESAQSLMGPVLLTKQTPKQTPPKPQPAFAVACRPQGPKVSPESRAKEPRMAAFQRKPQGCFGQTSIDSTSVGFGWEKRPLKRETSPNGKSIIKSGFHWMVFFFSEAAIEKKIRCQLISSHFIGPPLFLSMLNAAKTWRGCLKRPWLKHMAKKQAKTINHVT